MSALRGRFVSVEGIDGAGKSTHIEWLAERIRARGHEVVLTREPGGTPLGEGLRKILLADPMDVATEALLMFAARHENVRQVIAPALLRGAWVVSDRFTDASFAYQGAGKGLSEARLRVLEDWVLDGLAPDLTILFDLDVREARARLADARTPDKFESESAAFFEKVRQGYLERARESPERIRVVSGSASIDDIRVELEKYLSTL